MRLLVTGHLGDAVVEALPRSRELDRDPLRTAVAE
jgi:hypothetical protein